LKNVDEVNVEFKNSERKKMYNEKDVRSICLLTLSTIIEREGVGSFSHCHPHPQLNAKQLLSGLALLVDGQKKMK